MSTFEDSAIYEYCELLYNELENKDGSYYPLKHDKYVFQDASLKFNMPIEKVKEIYHTHSEISAALELKKYNRLEPTQKQKVLKSNLSNILRNNRNLPFYQKEGPPSENLPLSLDIIFDEYKDMLTKMAENGWTIPLTFKLEKFEDLNKFTSDEEFDNFFTNYYSNKNFKTMCDHTLKAIQNAGQKELFEQCVATYNTELYSACLTTLITILEGLLSLFGGNPSDIKMKKICNFHLSESISKGKKIKALSWSSMYIFIDILFDKSDFSNTEPSKTNRHWIVHGRTSKIAEKADCLRVFNAISTLVCIEKFKGKVK